MAQYYSLNDMVFLVEGRSKDCLYDLGNRKLYHIQKGVSDLIRMLCLKGLDVQELSDEQCTTVEKLKGLNLLKPSPCVCALPDIQDLKSKPKILFAWIEITTFCNLKCKHCYNESSSQCQKYMSYIDFTAVCSELLSIGIKKIQIIGGEPLCHKDIRQILEYASSKFESVEVFTNGTLIDEEWCKFFSYHSMRVAISVYSYQSEEHDNVTMQNGSHDKTIHALDLLKKSNVPYRVATVYMKGINVGEKNTELYRINPVKDVIRMVGRGNIGLLTPELFKRKLITRATFKRELNPKTVLCNVTGHRCFSSKIYISVGLEVFPCVMERRLSHGNLRENHLQGLLKTEIQELDKSKITGCKDCELRYACHTCLPDSLSDDVFSKPYYCTYDVDTGEFVPSDTIIASILNDSEQFMSNKTSKSN